MIGRVLAEKSSYLKVQAPKLRASTYKTTGLINQPKSPKMVHDRKRVGKISGRGFLGLSQKSLSVIRVGAQCQSFIM